MNRSIKKLVLRDVKIPLTLSETDYDNLAISTAKKKIRALRLKYRPDENSFAIFKKSVDARKKNEISFVYSVIFSVADEVVLSDEKYEDFCFFCRKHSLSVIDEEKLLFETFSVPEEKRPVIAALALAECLLPLYLQNRVFAPLLSKGERMPIQERKR